MVFTCIAEKNGTTPQQEPGRQGGVGWGLSSQLQHVHRLEILISVSKQFETDLEMQKTRRFCQCFESTDLFLHPLI